jgi:hypothetical protein
MAQDNAHMNNHAGILFWIAITSAGKTRIGAVSIQVLRFPSEFCGWAIVSGLFLGGPAP